MRRSVSTLFILIYAELLFAQSVLLSHWINDHYQEQDRLLRGLVFDIIQDSLGFLWFGTESGLVQYDGIQFKTYRQLADDSNSLSDNFITALAEDRNGHLWVGTSGGGLNLFDRKHDHFFRYAYNERDENSLGHNKINEILIRDNGQLWVSTDGGGVHLWKKDENHFIRFQKPEFSSNFCDALLETKNKELIVGSFFGVNTYRGTDGHFELTDNLNKLPGEPKVVRTIAEDNFGTLWIGMRDGGLYFKRKTDPSIQSFRLNDGKNGVFAQSIYELFFDSEIGLWVCAEDGLYLLQMNQYGVPRSYSHIQFSEYGRVFTICKSRDKVLWLGTSEGIVVLAPNYKPFKYLSLDPGLKETIGVASIHMSEDGHLIVGSSQGLFAFRTTDTGFHRKITDMNTSREKLPDQGFITSVLFDKSQNLWFSSIGGFDNSFTVQCIRNNGSLINYSSRCLPFRSHATYAIVEDNQGCLWFANGSGLIYYDTKKDSFTIYQHDPANENSLSGNFINCLWYSNHSGLWIGTNEAGLNYFDPQSKKFLRYPFEVNMEGSINSRRIHAIYEDHFGDLWLTTEAGISRFNPGNNHADHYTYRDNLPQGGIRNLLPADGGGFWVSNDRQLCYFNPEAGSIFLFDEGDGIRNFEFWNRTAFRDRQGRIYFGGDRGFIFFNPDSLVFNPEKPQAIFTGFSLFNREVKWNPGSSILNAQPNFISDIVLKHSENVFTLHFCALSFINPGKNQFAVRMDGFESDWQNIGRRNESTYTNLNPGKYRFLIKAANNDKLWGDATPVSILILPPWWRTWWAILLFLVCLGAILWYWHEYRLKARLIQAETLRLKELNDFKSHFYTNITHDFRTPLTLILGPVERAIEGKKLDIRDLKLIRRNGRRLLSLINSMLDLSKLDSGHLKADYRKGDIVFFMHCLVESFRSYAIGKSMDLIFFTPLETWILDYDPEKLTNVVSNLLSNAVKFSPNGGKIIVSVCKISGRELYPGEWLQIEVEDNGPGIDRENISRVFDRFYHSKASEAGSGIGLAIAKELVEWMGGQILVESIPGQTIFKVFLPATYLAPLENTINYMDEDRSELAETFPQVHQLQGLSKNHIVLIIEDNPDMAAFIARGIRDQYNLAFAKDGKEGWAKTLELIPDIIISDVMMPEISGIELVRILKNDSRTSHIPIILLTAKVDFESRLIGLGEGADVYLEKPFREEELKVQLKRLCELQKLLQRHYQGQSIATDRAITMENVGSQVESTFLGKVRSIMEKHLDEAHLSIEDLSHSMGMSHSQLHRKMVALTGFSTIHFLRLLRLEQAKSLLQEDATNVSEVAYSCGFSDPSYFTKVFTREFGLSPSEWRQKQKMP